MDINGLFLTKAANALDQRSSCRVTRIWQATDEQRVAVVCYGAVEGEGDAISFAAEGGTLHFTLQPDEPDDDDPPTH